MRYIVLALALSVLSAHAVDVNIQERSYVTLAWQHPTEYVDGSPLPIENIHSTIIERNCYDTGWVVALEVPRTTTDAEQSAQDPIASLGEGVCLYRSKTVAIGAVIDNAPRTESGWSNTVEVNLYRPKSATAPILRAE